MANRLVFIGGGNILEKLRMTQREETVFSAYGACVYSVAEIEGKEIFSIHRHEAGHQLAAHNVDYLKIIATAAEIKPDCVFGISICGSYVEDINPGNMIFVDQLIDITRKRRDTFYESRGDVRHVDVYEPICSTKANALRKRYTCNHSIIQRATTLVCMDGPRLSTRAELTWYRAMGGDIVNMSMAPEAFLAREKGLCYVAISLVSDKASLDGSAVTSQDMQRTLETFERPFMALILDLIQTYRESHFSQCNCHNAPGEAHVATK